MPDPIRHALQAAKTRVPDTSARQRREEPQWNEYSVLAYDGLMPTQIVRRLTEQDGIDRWEATALPFRADARPDTDDRRNDTVPFLPNDPTRYVDDRRYVVDPMVGKHRFLGLWTGGPIRMTTDKRGGGREVTQVLTRTFCAGHGYKTDEQGNYVAVYRVGDGYNTRTDGSGAPVEADEVREFLTADEALKYHRPALGAKLSPYMALRDDIPASFMRQVQWREFTHESIQFLDPLGLKPENHARLTDIVTFHFYELAGEHVTDAACRVDEQTNTVIFTAAITYAELSEPDGPDDLIDLPCLETCDRDTLRMFGWGQLQDGEGYEYTHVFRWPRLKDSETTRRALEFVKDNAPVSARSVERTVWTTDPETGEPVETTETVELHPADSSFVLALLRKHGLLPASGDSAHAWFGDGEYEKRFGVERDDSQIDKTGRLVTEADARASGSGAIDPTTGTPNAVTSVEQVPVQTYRIAKQRVEPDQDGSISFVIALKKAEWHGGDDGRDWEDVDENNRRGSRVLAGVSAPQGYGISEHRVIPSVPRESAIPTMKAIEARDDYEIVVETRQTEGQSGSSDVSFQRKRLYDFIDGSHVPENIVNVDNNPFNATTYNYDPNSNTYHLGWTYVSPAGLQNLVDSVRKKLGGNPVVHTEWHPEGYYSVRITAKGKEPKHVREWMVAADWFKHETLEQWIGVTVKTRQTPGQDDDPSAEILGFYTRYQRDPVTGEYIVDSEGNLVPDETSFVYFREIRGDLDANWMGSDPQDTGTAGTAAVLDPTTGTELTPAVLATNGGAADYPTMFVTCGAANGGEGTKYPLVGDSAPSHADQHGNGWSGPTWDDPDFGDGDDSAGDSADKKRSHVLTRVHPRRNDDGSYDISISRIYPHQRYWEWTLPSMDSDGDEYDTRHFSYHNWPSRKAIKKDIIDRIKAEVQSDWDDGWAIGGSFSVNQFGLIDAPNCSLVPTKGNGKARVARARTIQEYFQYEQQHPVRSYKAPSGKDPKKVPPNGYWEKVDVWTVEEGYSTDYQYAKNRIDAYSPLYEGSRGIWRANNKHGIQSAWAWHVVAYIEPGEWDGEDLPQGGGNGSTGSDGNNSTVDSGGDGGGREGGNTTPGVGESGGGESGGGET